MLSIQSTRTMSYNVPTTTLPIETDTTRRFRMLRLFCLLSMAAHSVGTLTLILMVVLTGQTFLFIGPASSLLALICFATSYLRTNNGHYRSGCWLLAWANTLSIAVYAWSLGTGVAVVLGFFIPIGLAIVLMKNWEIALVTLGCSLFSVVQYVTQGLLKIYVAPVNLDLQVQTIPNIALAAFIIPIIVLLLAIPAHNLSKATSLLEIQTARLQEALNEVELRQQSSQQVSQQVSSLATELNATASQQAGGSQEQVATVSQIRVSVNELSLTASSIDEMVEQVDQAAYRVAGDSQQIEQTTSLSVSHGELGLQSANRTIEISQDVARLYQQFLTTLTEVVARNASMRTILNLLGSLSAETHLLALNAAIEAAGAGEYGQRFAIVAQEIKNLSDRSSMASKEIGELVQQIEGAVKSAEISVRDGYTRAEELAKVAKQSGQVIEQMEKMTEQAQVQANSIHHAVRDVKTLTATIKAATAQQRSASLQVLESLDGLTTVAQYSAQGSSHISQTVTHLEDLSQRLTLSLAN